MRERNEAIRAAYAGGVSINTLAVLFGISRQRIHQIIQRPRLLEEYRVARLLWTALRSDAAQV